MEAKREKKRLQKEKKQKELVSLIFNLYIKAFKFIFQFLERKNAC